LFKVIYKSVS